MDDVARERGRTVRGVPSPLPEGSLDGDFSEAAHLAHALEHNGALDDGAGGAGIGGLLDGPDEYARVKQEPARRIRTHERPREGCPGLKSEAVVPLVGPPFLVLNTDASPSAFVENHQVQHNLSKVTELQQYSVTPQGTANPGTWPRTLYSQHGGPGVHVQDVLELHNRVSGNVYTVVATLCKYEGKDQGTPMTHAQLRYKGKDTKKKGTSNFVHFGHESFEPVTFTFEDDNKKAFVYRFNKITKNPKNEQGGYDCLCIQYQLYEDDIFIMRIFSPPWMHVATCLFFTLA